MTVPQTHAQSGSPLIVTQAIDPKEWDDFVQRTENASFCHLSAWHGIIEDVMGHRAILCAARDTGGGGGLAGVVPLFRLRSRLFGDHLVSVPFMNYGGPCGSPEARQLLTQWALDEARNRNVDSLLLRARFQTPGGFAVAQSKITAVLALPASADEMWNKSFDAKFRNKIKRPQRDGMETRFGPEQLNAFYEVFAHNMRDLGTPVLPGSFFERIVAALPRNTVVGATYLKDRAVAAGFGFIWRDEFEMTWSSSLKELRASKPNMLLYWDYMRELIGRGVRRFNFGRSTPGSGPHEFKLSWGAVDEPLPWIQWPESSTGSGESRVAQLASAVWKHLPLGVTRTVGPVLARQLPWW